MRVLVVEDEPAVAAGLVRGLEEVGIATDQVSDADSARRLIEHNLPYDVAILDVMLDQETDGYDLCRRIRDRGLATRVLMLTARDDLRDRLAGFDAGADDYLTKPFFFDEVLARVRALERRTSTPARNASISQGNVHLHSEAQEIAVDGKTLKLTKREYDILELFLRNQGRLLSKQQIYDAIWNRFGCESLGLVDTYIARVRRKLEEAGAKVAIENNRGFGFKLSVCQHVWR